MSVPIFNTGGVNGLAALNFANSGMSGCLAANGNTVRVLVGTPQVRTVESSPPGGNWQMVRSLGLGPRRVVWHARLVSATSGGAEANLNTVEAAIERYLIGASLADGGIYSLTDGKGRTSDYAVLLPTGTGRVGLRETNVRGTMSQHWVLEFSVLWPQVGAPTAL